MIGALWSPYEVFMKLGVIAAGLLLIAGLGAWAGYAWQADEVEDARAAQSAAEGKRDEWKERAEGLARAVDEQKKANANAVKEARLAQLAAEASVVRANDAAERFLRGRDEYNRLIAAEKVGICRAQLEAPLCGSPLR